MRVAAPNDGTFAVGPARLMVETADGEEAVFLYREVTAEAEAQAGSGGAATVHGEEVGGQLVASGLLFTAPAGGSFPLSAAYAAEVADPAVFPIVWRADDGSRLRVLAPNDGTFAPGPAAVVVKESGGEETVLAYKSMEAGRWSHAQGPGGLELEAADGVRFPATGAFAGPGKAEWVGCGGESFKVSWRAAGGGKLKVTAPNDGSFNLGPSRLLVQGADGGWQSAAYARVAVAGADRHGPAGMLFTAPPSSVFPRGAVRVEPTRFPEPFPVAGRSADGAVLYLHAPNDGSLPPGRAALRLRLSDGSELAFKYAFLSWDPALGGSTGGLVVTAARGVRFPPDAAYAGPLDGLRRCARRHLPPPVQRWPEAPPARTATCRPQVSPVTIVGVASKGAAPAQVGTACPSARVFSDRGDGAVFRELPAVLLGQPFVRTGDADRGATGADELSLQVDAPAYVFLLWDETAMPAQGGALPAWVSSGFKETGLLAWTSVGQLAVLSSLMPVSGPVLLGGCDAPPSSGCRRNYVAVMVRAQPAASGWAAAAEEEGLEEGSTWLKKLHTHAAGLQVLLYVDPRTILVRAPYNPLPAGPGYMRVLRAKKEGAGGEEWEGTAGAAQGGQLVVCGVSQIEQVLVGYPGWRIHAAAGQVFPGGMERVQPTTFAVAAVRPGGAQLQVAAPGGEELYGEGPGAVQLVLRGGETVEAPYESAALLPPHARGGVLLSAPAARPFPAAARFAAPGSAAAAAAAPRSGFPVAGGAFAGGYAVVWESGDRRQLRVTAGPQALEPGPAAVKVRTHDPSVGAATVEYQAAAAVVADSVGPAGVLLTARKASRFPAGAASVEPRAMQVLAVRAGGEQMQVGAPMAAFPEGPGAVWVVRGNGVGGQYPYQTAGELVGGGRVLLSAPGGFAYPADALYVAVERAPTAEEHAGGELARNGSEGAPWLEAHPSGALVVTDVRARSGGPTAVGVAVAGEDVYADSKYKLVGPLPGELDGEPMVKLPAADKASTAYDAVSLYVSAPAWVYVLRDAMGTPQEGGAGRLPLWMRSGFAATGEEVRTTDPRVPAMAVYRSTAPLQGPVTLGGNAAYPAVGAQGNYAVVLKSAGGSPTLTAPEEGEAGHSESKRKEGHAEREDAATAGGAGSGAGMERMLAGCGGKEAAMGCLQELHSCMAPYRMGDLSSCHCFYGGKGRGADAHTGWVGKEWCSDQCRLAVYEVYNDRVTKETGFPMGCGLGNE